MEEGDNVFLWKEVRSGQFIQSKGKQMLIGSSVVVQVVKISRPHQCLEATEMDGVVGILLIIRVIILKAYCVQTMKLDALLIFSL